MDFGNKECKLCWRVPASSRRCRRGLILGSRAGVDGLTVNGGPLFCPPPGSNSTGSGGGKKGQLNPETSPYRSPSQSPFLLASASL